MCVVCVYVCVCPKIDSYCTFALWDLGRAVLRIEDKVFYFYYFAGPHCRVMCK